MAGDRKSPVSRDPATVRARILDAAQAEFMAEGYAAASTNRIVARFEGSKPTVFRHFPTKRALYEAVVTRIADRWAERIDWRSIDVEEPRAWLERFAAMALRWILSDENLFLGRMAVTEGAELTNAAALYRAHASAPIEALLAERFAGWTVEGRLASTDPARDATAFLDLTLAGMVSRRLYGMPPLDEGGLADHVRHTVGLFLDGRGRET
jgi:TetR/AcrR family transcriptional regulator, mexJK operon transcriptional repressor